MQLLDWLVVAGFALLTLVIGLRYSWRAGANVDEYFLSGRTLPWWIAGTSMVATTFAADTPLVITGWVRDLGIWKNWLWWCFAINGLFGVFLFARWWRRGQVMTKAELAELRYGGREARVLRGVLGGLHAGVANTMVLCWVLLAAAKILDVLLEVDKVWALSAACAIALSYSLMAGFWGVVVTDLVQFALAVVGALMLAVLCWQGIGGGAGFEAARAGGEVFSADTLRFLPSPGEGAGLWPGSWSVPFAALAVYLGVGWWAIEGVDGESTIVQRVSASRDARQGMLATLWFCVAHFALRPWPWILVALASLVVLPTIEVRADSAGEVVSVSGAEIVVTGAAQPEPTATSLVDGYAQDWRPLPLVAPQQHVEAGALLARTDSERAYVVMMRRFLPVGLLGLVVASLLAAFMSTIDTHVNLASSYFVNDVYRRFLHPRGSQAHYVLVARIASAVVLVVGGVFAYYATHIGRIFELFLALLGGVGPVYVLRWTWWRVRASTEITAMIASAATALVLTFTQIDWPDTVLTPGGVLEPTTRTCLVVLVSAACAGIALFVAPRPDPASLVPFYRRVRPLGWWGPVRALCPDARPPREASVALLGVGAGLALIYGLLFGLGALLIGTRTAAVVGLGVALVGGLVVARVLRRFGPDGEVRAP